jgi:hypothetical protein
MFSKCISKVFRTLLFDRLEQNHRGEAAIRQPSKSRLLLVLLSIPVLAIPLAFLMQLSPALDRRVDSDWLRVFAVPFTTRNQQCDIVIFGDSSAVTAIDTDMLTRLTGMSSCNMAQTLGDINVTGMDAFAQFLDHNPRPKVILIEFGVYNLHDPGDWAQKNYHLEGSIYDLRYESTRHWLRDYLTHPDDAFVILKQSLFMGPKVLFLDTFKLTRRIPVNERSVHMPIPAVEMKSCAQWVGKDEPNPPDLKWIQSVRQQFQGRADVLLFNISPDDPCNDYWQQHSQLLQQAWQQGLVDRRPDMYPVTLFNDPTSPHYTAEGSERLTEETAAQILAASSRSKPEAQPNAHTP